MGVVELDVKIAVIGQSMSGKSSLINNLLGQDVATVSATEKSDEGVEMFVAPKNENVKLFEIPAITGLELTRDNFFEKANFDSDKYDFIVFVTKQALNSDDYFLVKEFQGRHIPITILHTNTYVALPTNGGEDIEAFLEQKRTSFTSKLRKAGVDAAAIPVYFVENTQIHEFELKQSISNVLDLLPEEKKQMLQSALDDNLLIEENIEYEQIHRWQDAEVNIAVVGSAASGKTTFIKTFLGESSAVRVPQNGGLVFESTKNPNIKIHEIKTSQMHLEMVQQDPTPFNFDYIFFLIQKDLSIEDFYVILQLQQLQLSMSLMKTHSDEFAENERDPEVIDRKLRECEATLRSKLVHHNLNVSIHFIDARDFLTFRFLTALEKLLENLEESKRVSLIHSLQIFENCHSWYPVRIDILVVGQSRHGKSSFINALVGDTVATVGHFENCTTEVTEYSLPKYPNIRIYDAAGVSSTDCTRKEFEAKARLNENNYDAFFMVIKDVYNNDAEFIRKKIEEKKRPFSIVRTHADVTAGECYNSNESRIATEKHVCEKVRQKLKNQLTALKVNADEIPIYVVSNKNCDRFDFPKIIEDLSRNLPKVKAQQFLLCVTSFDPKMIDAKYKELNNLKWRWALASGTGGLIPIPGPNIAADIGILVATTVKFLSAFGLSKERINAQEKLQRFPKGCLEKELVKFMKYKKFDILLALRNSAYFKEGLRASSAGTAKLATVVVPSLTRAMVMTTADEVLKATGVFIVAGMAVGAISSFCMTWYLLDRELSNAKKCAILVSTLIQSRKQN